jgi:hypothetical protein
MRGYAIKIKGLPWDHTYVRSDEGNVWPCWGRSAGGRAICEAIGDLNQSDCLSQPNSQAGIVYGVTGVCHQTANRILYTAGIMVSQASGYRGSVFAWGRYGREGLRLFAPPSVVWPEFVKCIG